MRFSAIAKVLKDIGIASTFLTLLLTAGCSIGGFKNAYATRAQCMIPSDFDVVKKHPYTIAVSQSTGGGNYTSGIMSLIWDEEFTKALICSLMNSHLFNAVTDVNDETDVTDSNVADYILYVTILKYDKPICGADLDIKTKMKWELKQTKNSQTVWSETIETTYKTKFSESANPAFRAQIATEGSARANIREGIRRLSMATF
jgi:hypothetical protein